MPLVFVRKGLFEIDAQRSLFDPLVAGRSFERSAHRIAHPRTSRPMTDDMLRRRLADLDLQRRRAQIRARKALNLDAVEPASMELPFPERAAS
jgi:hypothetical protein